MILCVWRLRLHNGFFIMNSFDFLIFCFWFIPSIGWMKKWSKFNFSYCFGFILFWGNTSFSSSPVFKIKSALALGLTQTQSIPAGGLIEPFVSIPTSKPMLWNLLISFSSSWRSGSPQYRQHKGLKDYYLAITLKEFLLFD